jgi:hypothetical protein
MIAVVTYLELKSPFKFFALSYNALQIIKQLKRDAKHKEYKSTGIWTKHYTMTLWENEQDMRAFAKSGAHLEAMKKSAQIAKQIKTLTFETTALPSWKTAKEKLMKEGTVVSF